ncbi:unnamed protein product, partial [Meganyctiphanes norvegica]
MPKMLISANFEKMLILRRKSSYVLSVQFKHKTDACFEEYTIQGGESLVFMSPGFPNYYFSYQRCSWLVNVDSSVAANLKISCSNFDLPESYDCSQSFLYIHSVTGQTSMHCGRDAPDYHIDWQSGENSIFIFFQAAKGQPRQGFSCSVEALPIEEEIVPLNCSCGKTLQIESRILGGSTVVRGHIPWQIAIIRKQTDYVLCGGALVNDRWAITAAHCHAGVVKFNISIEVLVGAVSTKNFISRVQVENIIPHPNYDRNRKIAEAVNIQGDRKLRYTTTNGSSIACERRLHLENYEGMEAMISGWGRLSYRGDRPEFLQFAKILTYTQSFCRRMGHWRVTDTMLCGGVPDGTIDACQNESPCLQNLLKKCGYFATVTFYCGGGGLCNQILHARKSVLLVMIY